MKVTINKKETILDDGLTLKDVLAQVPNIPATGIAVTVNGDVVPKADWENKVIADGDTIVVIKAFYGG